MSNNPGCVITTEAIAALVGEAWPQSMTPINILSGFRKTGIHPFNPSEVNDRQLAPSLAVTVPKVDGPSVQKDPTDTSSCHSDSSKICSSDISTCPSDPLLCQSSVISGPCSTSTSTSSVLYELLLLPNPMISNRKKKPRKPALNKKAVCITDSEILEQLKQVETKKVEAELEREARRIEKEEQKKKREEKKKKEKEKQKREKEEKKKLESKVMKKGCQRVKSSRIKDVSQIEKLYIADDDDEDESECEDQTVCTVCGLIYGSDDSLWVGCDGCNQWFDLKCTNIRDKYSIPDTNYFCQNCKE